MLSVININSVVVNHAHIVQGQPQRKGVSPAVVRQLQSLKYVNNVSCVDQLYTVKLAPNVAQNLGVGAGLNQFWETWEASGARQSSTNVERGLHPTFPTPDQT